MVSLNWFQIVNVAGGLTQVCQRCEQIKDFKTWITWQLLKKIAKMILSLVFFCFCGIVTCSPVAEVQLFCFHWKWNLVVGWGVGRRCSQSSYPLKYSPHPCHKVNDVPYHHHSYHKVEDRGLVSDIAMGILVGKIQEMLGITTTPKPRPIIGIFIIFFNTSSTYLYSSPTSQQPNRWHCRPPGCHNYNSRPTHRRREVAFPTKWEQKKNGNTGNSIHFRLGLLQTLFSLFFPAADTTTTTAAPTTTKCGGLLGGKCLWTSSWR